MVKIVLIALVFFNLYAKEQIEVYDNNCIKCHKKLPVSIDKYFYKYLLKYSSEEATKKAMFDYLKEPSKEATIMSESFIKRFGIKEKTKLSDEKLNDALDVYWEKYKVFGKLK